MHEPNEQHTTPAVWCVNCGCDSSDLDDIGAALLLDEDMDWAIQQYHSAAVQPAQARTDSVSHASSKGVC